MMFSKSITSKLSLLFLLFIGVLAAPAVEPLNAAELVKRRTGDSESNPIDVEFDITGWSDIAELDCFAILCRLGGKLVYQRVASESDRKANYQGSGAGTRPFQRTNLDLRHTKQINSGTTSSEEFPWESTTSGGEHAHNLPATMEQQRRQGARLKDAYQKSNTQFSDWFRIKLVGSPMGKYCTALFSRPPNYNVCDENPAQTLFGTDNVKIPDYDYQIDKQKRPYTFFHPGGSNSKRRSNYAENFDSEIEKEEISNEEISN